MSLIGSDVNIGKKERAVSLAGGAALALFGLSKRSKGGALLALLGGVLALRGATGHCHAKAAMDKKGGESDIGDEHEKSKEAPGHNGILVTKQVTIDKSPDELYAFWRKLENLPQFMQHLESVEETGEKTSHWVAKAPLNNSVSWDAEIIRDEPGHLLEWRSIEGSTIPNSGSVRFVAVEDRGTEVKVNIEYQPPLGALGAAVAKLFGEEPQIQVDDDLKRFKQLMETGEITNNGRK